MIKYDKLKSLIQCEEDKIEYYDSVINNILYNGVTSNQAEELLRYYEELVKSSSIVLKELNKELKFTIGSGRY